MLATDICRADIENLLRLLPTVREPELSFPQANSMSRVINLMELLSEKPMTKQEITSEYAFDERQTNYYTDAGRYLEIIEKGRDGEGNILFRLSSRGRYIMSLPSKERQLAMISQILGHKVLKRR